MSKKVVGLKPVQKKDADATAPTPADITVTRLGGDETRHLKGEALARLVVYARERDPFINGTTAAPLRRASR